MDSAERARRAADLFEAAADLDPAARAAFLDIECGGDTALRQEVESLLSFHDRGPTDDLFPPLFSPPAPSLVGERIGPYRVLREIAEGGMGAVYLAEREDVGKRVALKLVRHGRLASPEQLQRFLLERRVLARLEHPHIARLLDAGVTHDGLPYLVMEYVEGEPLDRYCDRQRLTVPERLRLFADVCRAVQYAHRSLIVHRDLKPSNILVDGEGQVKLLDFGIAKLLEEGEGGEGGLTRAGLAPLTPEYASPEQVRGEPVTTASDVYALGIVLYELLCGHRPYQVASRSPGEVERVVCSTDPLRPSTAVMRVEEVLRSGGASERITPEEVSNARGTHPEQLRRRLHGDLDTIVLKALAKEPDRRYQSARELAEDLERHLGGLPVRAHRDTLGYRAGKFVRRHRMGVGAAGAVFLSLVIGLAAALWQSYEASRQRDLAIQAANTMIFELAEGLSRMTGPTESRLGLLTRAVEIFENIGGAGAASAEQQRRAADGYRVLAQTYGILGDAEHALRYATRAEQRARRLAARRGSTAADRLALAGAMLERGDALAANGREEEALAAYSEGIALADSLAREPGATADAHRVLHLLLSRRADRLFDRSETFDEAHALYRRALAAAEELLRHEPENVQYQGFRATITERLADVLYYSGRVEESCEGYRQALRLREQTERLAPSDVTTLRTLAISMQNVGWCSEREGNLAATVRLYTEATMLQRRLVDSDPSNTLLTSNLIGGLGELANTLRGQDEMAEAVRRYREAVEVGEAFLRRAGPNTRVGGITARILPLLADALVEQRQHTEAGAALARAEELLTGLMALDPASVEHPRALADVMLSTADLQRARGERELGIPRYRQALEGYRNVAAISGLATDRERVAFAHYKVAMALKQAGRLEPAREELLRGRQLLLNLRAAGQLSEASDGQRRYLPAIEEELANLGR